MEKVIFKTNTWKYSRGWYDVEIKPIVRNEKVVGVEAHVDSANKKKPIVVKGDVEVLREKYGQEFIVRGHEIKIRDGSWRNEVFISAKVLDDNNVLIRTWVR